MKKWTLAIPVCMVMLTGISVSAQVTETSTDYALRATSVGAGLDHPWGFTFLPDDSILVTERSGLVKHIKDGVVLTPPQPDLPVRAVNQGGLLDIALSPQFGDDQSVYFTFTHDENGAYGTALAKSTIAYKNGIVSGFSDTEILFSQKIKTGNGRHFGSRIVFDLEGQHIFFSIGDRGERNRAQVGLDSAGKIIRLKLDGSIPEDNPFVGNAEILEEIWSIGHRNPQGMALDTDTGSIWTTEHGARGGDEVNRPEAGRNYGWPTISYGRHYSFAKIGEGTHKNGMEQPVYYWDPSIAPSGLAYYSGTMFPKWQGQFFAGALKDRKLLRLRFNADKTEVIEEEILFEREFGRIRDVEQGPDGALYLITDDDEGQIIRIAVDG